MELMGLEGTKLHATPRPLLLLCAGLLQSRGALAWVTVVIHLGLQVALLLPMHEAVAASRRLELVS
jgi:hypothetical protein